jgi:pyruvate kinase
MQTDIIRLENEKLYNELYDLRHVVSKRGAQLFAQWKPKIKRSVVIYSACNLAFYLALRCYDLRHLQKALLPLGLSSLGRSEARAIANLDAVMASLGRICGKSQAELIDYPSRSLFFLGDKLLRHNTNLIFGRERIHHTHIMVTLPPEAADDYALVRDLVKAGMDTARINCAHDTLPIWHHMIHHVRCAEKETGYRCKIYMDLAGPKVRISSILVKDTGPRIMAGNTIFMVSGDISDYPREYTGSFVIACSIPEIFQTLKLGDAVLIDEGKIRTVVTSLTAQGAELTVVYAKPKGERLKNQKSLNFPHTPIPISPLTPKDLEDLDFIANHADAIGYSFVKCAADIALLQDELVKRRGSAAYDISIIAKIETSESVKNLPEIIVQAASRQPLGIMIARGDLAVEVGYHRLSELQEEILWICEAAHVPVIWATQVLENMVKTGIPSRAEITDAAMSERAECVMLNKGPFILQAVNSLADILDRMQEHQHKKAPQLKALHIAINTLKKNLPADVDPTTFGQASHH